jgi:hypothetical protein
VRRFDDADDPALQVQVASALVNKGVALGALNRHDEALAVFNDVVQRFRSSTSPELRELSNEALKQMTGGSELMN